MHSLVWLYSRLMMIHLSTCALIFLGISTTRLVESLAGEQAIFRKSEQKYFPNHVMQTKETNSELECGLHCVAEKSCTSVNYKTRGMGKGRCELNNKTVEKTADFDNKIHHPEFNHLAILIEVSIQLYTVKHALIFR